MPIQPIEILDTAIKIGLGAAVGGIFTYLLERSKQKSERIKEHLRLRQEKIIDSIVTFIDELLMSLSETYWSHLDQVESNVREKIIVLRNKEAMIAARAAALCNEELSKNFAELTRQLIMVREKLAEDKIVSAHDEKERAVQLAGKVLALLFELEKSKV